jgi:CRP-like cAMP-binding protein
MKNVDYFENINDEILKEIFYSLKQLYFQDGETIFKLGDNADSLYFLCSGSIEIFIPGTDGEEVLIETL